MRDVCSTKLLSAPIVLGGPGTVVQIDEPLFVHNRKVAANYFTFSYNCSVISMQNGRGCQPAQEQWVFGMVGTILKAYHWVYEIGPKQNCSYTNGNH